MSEYRYTGVRGIDFLHGVPARDLNADDVAGLTPEGAKELADNLQGDDPIYKVKAPPKGRKGEQADPTVTGETDADVTGTGGPTNLDVPPVLPAGDTIAPIIGEPETPGVVASDHI